MNSNNIYFSEDSYTFSIDKRAYEVRVVSFWLYGELLHRVFLDDQKGHLMIWDNNSAGLQPVDNPCPIPDKVIKALNEKVSADPVPAEVK
jgi:hypothetical protein